MIYAIDASIVGSTVPSYSPCYGSSPNVGAVVDASRVDVMFVPTVRLDSCSQHICSIEL